MPFDDNEPELEIAEELMDVQWNDDVYELMCKVSFNLPRGLRIVTAPLEINFKRIPDLNDRYSLKRKATGQSIDVLPTRIPRQITDRISVVWHFTPRTAPIFLDDGGDLHAVRFGVVNFGEFYAANQNGPGLIRDRLELRSGGWVLTMEPMTASGLGDVSTAESMFFKFTHAAVLTKDDGGPFRSEEAHAALDWITSFFSFCRGRWVAPALVKGFAADGTLRMQEWGRRSIEPYTECATWLDRMQAQEMAKAFSGYMPKAADPDWHDAVYAAIYWYTRTNGTASGADGSLILVQAALERLAWQVLVRNKEVLSPDGFTRLPAADQLRLLLDRCSIPLQIPAGLKSLLAEAKAWNWADGPQAFVETRNSIVHPPKKVNGIKSSMAIYDAWRLGQWYLELVLLKIFDFDGSYSNRTREFQYAGQVDKVPWT